MDGVLALASIRVNTFLFPSVTTRVGFGRRKFPVSLAAKGGGPKEEEEEEEGEEDYRMKLDELDQMELKFGHLIGEDPKLTLAKIMARKVDPDASFLEVEKAFYRNKGKMVEIKELPFDVSNRPKKVSSSIDGLNLARPVLKKGAKFETENKPTPPSRKMSKSDRTSATTSTNKRSVPNVILRKPSVYVEEDVDDRLNRSSSSFRFKPNLTLKMGDRGKETFSDMTLLRKPEPASVHEKEKSSSDREDKIEDVGANLTAGNEDYGGFTVLKKPELKSGSEKSLGSFSDLVVKEAEVEVEEEDGGLEEEMRDDSVSGMQPVGNGAMESIEVDALVTKKSDITVNDSVSTVSLETALLGKPKRLDHSVEETSSSNVSNAVLVGDGDYRNVGELKDFDSSSAVDDADWTRAEELLKTGSWEQVELISYSARGFVVAFGSLIGFLPYRNLAAKWKFLAFESWLRQKGLEPSLYRKNLGIIGNYDALDKITPSDLSNGAGSDMKVPREVTADMKLEDLLRIYDQEKLKFLSSFVGQRIKVNVVMADRRLKKLIVSLRPKEKDELVEQKRNLMAKLQIGDVVRCCIKKITYFGIFVEVEGVPALIHQTEVSWDATLDPASYFKVGQIVEAKVHQLDFPLERIYLSLKETRPDPLAEALECVIGDRDPLGRLQAADADAEWAEVESLIEELQQIEGVQSVSKGRFFLSPGLAPTFQVYMASMYEDQYKLLARSGNKVQEVIVQASLSKEDMKSAILSCANRME